MNNIYMLKTLIQALDFLFYKNTLTNIYKPSLNIKTNNHLWFIKTDALYSLGIFTQL